MLRDCVFIYNKYRSKSVCWECKEHDVPQLCIFEVPAVAAIPFLPVPANDENSAEESDESDESNESDKSDKKDGACGGASLLADNANGSPNGIIEQMGRLFFFSTKKTNNVPFTEISFCNFFY